MNSSTDTTYEPLLGDVTPKQIEKANTTYFRPRLKRQALYACQECGHKFYSSFAAKRAAFGDLGCPDCGGSDIDIAL